MKPLTEEDFKEKEDQPFLSDFEEGCLMGRNNATEEIKDKVLSALALFEEKVSIIKKEIKLGIDSLTTQEKDCLLNHIGPKIALHNAINWLDKIRDDCFPIGQDAKGSESLGCLNEAEISGKVDTTKSMRERSLNIPTIKRMSSKKAFLEGAIINPTGVSRQPMVENTQKSSLTSSQVPARTKDFRCCVCGKPFEINQQAHMMTLGEFQQNDIGGFDFKEYPSGLTINYAHIGCIGG